MLQGLISAGIVLLSTAMAFGLILALAALLSPIVTEEEDS